MLTVHKISEIYLVLPLWKAMSPIWSQLATGWSHVNHNSSNCFMTLQVGMPSELCPANVATLVQRGDGSGPETQCCCKACHGHFGKGHLLAHSSSMQTHSTDPLTSCKGQNRHQFNATMADKLPTCQASTGWETHCKQNFKLGLNVNWSIR